jgi:lysophospholipid acyltransferase (LPLAT)-like uncharacterized protein
MGPARALLLLPLRLWLRSLRIRGPGAVPERGILMLWHEDLPACMRAFARLGVHVLISRSRDGDLAAALCRSLDYNVHRGSSTRGSLAGMKALARGLESDGGAFEGLAGMALDGPRGPRREPKGGTLWLARHSGLPVFPIRVHARNAIRLGTWDRAVLPLPFSRVDVSLGPPSFPESLADLAMIMRESGAPEKTRRAETASA